MESESNELAGHSIVVPGTLALDNPGWSALTGPQAQFAETKGHAARFATDMFPLAAIGDWTSEQAWGDLAALVAPDTTVALAGVGLTLPSGWESVGGGEALQMVGTTTPEVTEDSEAVVLSASDVPEILALVARTRPGPFLPRTVELGTYWGIRRHGVLVAMAGERMRTPGWTEISAVCTDEAYRGQGLARRLINLVAAGIGDRGDRPFLHVAAGNDGPRRLYESMGFRLRSPITLARVRVPGGAT